MHCLHLVVHRLAKLAERSCLCCHLIWLVVRIRLLGDSSSVLGCLHLYSLWLLHLILRHLVHVLWLRHLSLRLLLKLVLSCLDHLSGGPNTLSRLCLSRLLRLHLLLISCLIILHHAHLCIGVLCVDRLSIVSIGRGTLASVLCTLAICIGGTCVAAVVGLMGSLTC